MAWKKPDTLWDASPHTIAKIELLESYLKPWFAILGRSMFRQDIVYVDGFCGPCEYKNYPNGSPLAAINAANAVLNDPAVRWKAGNVHLVFIDKDKNSIDHLNAKLESVETHSRIHLRTIPKLFLDGLAEIKNDLSRSFNAHHPLFVFIDPFGATGISFTAIAEILNSACSEVLINLDADGIARIFQAGDRAGHEKNLRKIFDDDSWRALDASQSFQEKCVRVLELYKQKLKALPNVRYVFSFEMRKKGGLDYFLVFASQHPLGLKKMKEAMQRIDQTGAYQFSDTSLGQTMLFDFNKPEDFASSMYDYFTGRKISWQEVEDYALNETPFVNLKKMLAILERQKLIEVKMNPREKRVRKNTYPDNKVEAIIFAGDKNV